MTPIYRLLLAIVAVQLLSCVLKADGEADNERLIVQLPRIEQRITDMLLEVSTDGKSAIVADNSGRVVFVDVAKKQISQISTEHKSAVYGISILGKGKGAVTVSNDGEVMLWGSVQGGSHRVIARLPKEANDVDVEPKGRFAAVACDDGNVYICDTTENAEEWRILRGHDNKVSRVAYSRDGRFLISGDLGGVLKCWDTKTCKVKDSHKVDGMVNAIKTSPDGRLLAVSNSRSGTSLWDFKDGSLVASKDQLDGYFRNSTSVSFSSDGKMLALDTMEGVAIWPRDALKKPNYLSYDTPSFMSRFMPDSKSVLVVGKDGKVSVVIVEGKAMQKP